MQANLKEFRAFLLRGNVVDLAVAVVIGAAFTGVVNALVTTLLTPLIAAIFGEPDFSTLTFTINNSTFYYGAFLNSLITFLTIATAVFWFVVLPINRLMTALRTEPPVEKITRECPECLSDVPLAANRCAFCTSPLPD